MKAALLFPPATDPRAPHLAIPALNASLRRDGIEVVNRDLDLEGLLHVVSPASLERARAAIAERPTAGALALLRRTEASPFRIDDALAVYRDERRFCTPHDHAAARHTLFDAIDLVCAASPRVDYGLYPIRYDVEGCDTRRLRDLVRVTADPDANLFGAFWEDDVFPWLASESPDVVGISILNGQQMIPGLTLARALKARGHFVVIGGTVFTKFVNTLSRKPEFFRTFADAVVVYEGETALRSLMYELEGRRDFSKVPNLLYLDGERVRATAVHVESVNELPTPDFEGLPLDRYLAPRPVFPILFGKGCYFNRCKFCDIPFINHVSPKAYRVRDVERVAADVDTLAARFGARDFVFTDEALVPKLLTALGDRIDAQERGLSFVGYARLEPSLTRDVCRRLARMGFKKLFFGLESAAQETLDHMDKGIDVAGVPAVLRNCRDAGLLFHLFSIVGFPEESEESARKTMQFFVDHADLIDAPGNTFDVHEYGLELRTAYADACSSMGVLVSPAALERDFVIGLARDEWENDKGLTRERGQELLREVETMLRRRYRTHHHFPGYLYPMFEESSILWAEHYRGRFFPVRTTLPRLRSQRVRFHVNPAASIERDGSVVRVSGRHGSAAVPAFLFAALMLARARTVGELVETFRERSPGSTAEDVERALRRVVEELCLAGLLTVEVGSGLEQRQVRYEACA
jgi:hypothetical protein